MDTVIIYRPDNLFNQVQQLNGQPLTVSPSNTEAQPTNGNPMQEFP